MGAWFEGESRAVPLAGKDPGGVGGANAGISAGADRTGRPLMGYVDGRHPKHLLDTRSD
ncbi:MAG: hypothetical protein MJE77_16795 [Proteobacteria bacterium]|nr:hypothetical protein [Pseudomonadota bacterium]